MKENMNHCYHFFISGIAFCSLKQRLTAAESCEDCEAVGEIAKEATGQNNNHLKKHVSRQRHLCLLFNLLCVSTVFREAESASIMSLN